MEAGGGGGRHKKKNISKIDYRSVWKYVDENKVKTYNTLQSLYHGARIVEWITTDKINIAQWFLKVGKFWHGGCPRCVPYLC